MNVAVRANVRTAQAANDGLAAAMRVATWGGAVTGLFVVGLGLLVLGILTQVSPRLEDGLINPDALIGLGFGASLISVFARLGGGIYTKAADVGADLVGKVEAGIPEDDPRNPAVIADNVGDNVGDDAGMAADLFETLIVTAIAAMLLGHLAFKSDVAVWYPLALGGIGAIASIVGVFGVGMPSDGSKIMQGLYRGVWIASVLALGGMILITPFFGIPGASSVGLMVAAATGIGVTLALMYITDYYTSSAFQPVRGIARSSITGHGTNIIAGLAVGMKATAFPVLVIVAGTLLSYTVTYDGQNILSGLYGVSIAAMSMLSLCGIIVTVDAFGPITDNAGGIAEMAEMGDNVRNVTDPLDAVGNTTKAVTKGYAIGSAGLAALALFASYTAELEKRGREISFDLSDPLVVAGLFIGGILPGSRGTRRW
jgi:K(+)-stimulated pyrophosphate-energized sodium pump